jgi:hypothetical protein
VSLRCGGLPEAPDWQTERGRREAATEPVVMPIAFPSETQVSKAYMVSYDERTYAIGEQAQHLVQVFQFKGNFFLAHLEFIKGDPKAQALERVFLETIRSLRPVPK